MSQLEKPQVLLAPLQPLHLSHQLGDQINPNEVTLIQYDDANQLILVIVGRPGYMHAYDISSFPIDADDDEDTTSEPVWSLKMNEGPEPKIIRCSMGGADVVGIQRGPSLIEFIRRDSGNMFVSGARAKNCQILGFFWAFAPQCDLVLVTSLGLEQYKMGTEQGLKYITTRNALGGNISWYKYTHETRLVLVGVNSENRCKLSAYQFVSTEVVKIPQLDLNADQGAQIIPQDIHLLRMYNRVYCGLVKGNTTQLCFELYRFFTDKVVLQTSLPLLSHQVKLSVSDSVLVVHYTALAKTQLFDINQIQQPLGPLMLLGQVIKKKEGEIESQGVEIVPRYEQDWDFLKSNLVIKRNAVAAFRVCLDLKQIISELHDSSCAELVGFLLRRNAGKHPGQDPKGLAVELIKDSLIQRIPTKEARSIFDAVNDQIETFARSQTTQPTLRISKSFVLTPQEMGVKVFRALFTSEKMDAAYLECMLFEYIRSALKFTVYVPPDLFRLLIDVLVAQEKFYQVLLLVQLYPEMDSEPLVVHLESIYDQNQNVPKNQQAELKWCKTAAAMMVKRLGKGSRSPLQVQKYFSKYTDMLQSEGRAVDALKVIQQLKLRDADLEGYMASSHLIRDVVVKRGVERFAAQVQSELLAVDQGQGGLPVSQIPPIDVMSEATSD